MATIDDSEFLHNLRLVVYFRLYIDDIDLFPNFSAYIRQGYTGQEIAPMIETLERALEHSRLYDFQGLLPCLPAHDEIVVFLEKLLGRFKSSFDEETLEELSIPEDDRDLQVLVVEDRVYYHGFVETKFRGRTPYTVTRFSNCADAWDSVSQERFDVIVLSLHDDAGDNVKLLQTLRSFERRHNLPETPVLVLLEDDDKDYIDELYRAGCNLHLLLPVVVSSLLQGIYRLTTQPNSTERYGLPTDRYSS